MTIFLVLKIESLPLQLMQNEIHNRKGARKVQDIPKDVLALLNKGEISSVNLTEWLAIDHAQIVQHNFLTMQIEQKAIDEILKILFASKKLSAMQATKQIGTFLYEHYAENPVVNNLFEKLSQHQADSIRCYAPYLVALNPKLSIEEKLKKVENLVADTHFGVREIVWLALRPAINENLSNALQFLNHWAKNENENIRRFTTEATRPRGVWCKHIEVLKEKPEMALPILEQLKNDSAKYVQDSVGNWLNDASKSKPKFVINLCAKWEKENHTKANQQIIKRALRTINKVS